MSYVGCVIAAAHYHPGVISKGCAEPAQDVPSHSLSRKLLRIQGRLASFASAFIPAQPGESEPRSHSSCCTKNVIGEATLSGTTEGDEGWLSLLHS